MEDHSRRRYIYVDQLCTCLDLDLGAGAAGVGGGDGLVGGVDPHPAHAAGEELVALGQRHVVGLLHLELRLGQLHRREAVGQQALAAGRVRGARRRQQQQQQQEQ